MLPDMSYGLGRPCTGSPRSTSTSTLLLKDNGEGVSLLSFERPARAGNLSLGGHGARAHLENSIAAIYEFFHDQETKGTRWMPWRQEPKKDVGGCDKPG